MHEQDDDRAKSLMFDQDLSALVGSLNLRARAEHPVPDSALVGEAQVTDAPVELVELLEKAVRRGASDLLLVAGATPTLRVHGRLEAKSSPPLTGLEIRDLMLPVLDGRRRRELFERRFCDFAFDVDDVGRFRANVHFERGRLGACIRILPRDVPSLDALGLPSTVGRIVESAGGLVLVVGPAGTGKTTTLASLLAQIVRTRSVHAITIEEPVEYVHAHGESVVEQIEIPLDCPTFGDALVSAVRQSPDVLLVGEMRDAETMSAALTAAETGHLVLASMHAFTAPQAVHRVMDVFPAAQQEFVRRQLAGSLLGVLAQRLLPVARGGRRVLAVEVMWATDAVRNLIREGRMHNLVQVMASGRANEMVTMESSLADLVRRDVVDRHLALRYAYHPEELEKLI